MQIRSKSPSSGIWYHDSHITNMTAPRLLVLLMSVACLSGCAVIAVADAAVTVVATGVKVTAKAVGAVADAVIPD
ncbi:MAG: hypothetical protein PSV24_12275 [Rhodoferax sp.]|nr:hypothetical protein [Rhodoferax sp.]